MGLTMAEGALDTLKTWLEAQLPTHVTAVNTAHSAASGDATFITTPAFYVSEQSAMPTPPFAMILVDASSPVIDGPGHLKSRHDFTIILVDESMSHDALRRKLYRQVEAMVKCVKAGRPTVLSLCGLGQPYANFGAIYAQSPARYRLDVQCRVWLTLTEVE